MPRKTMLQELTEDLNRPQVLFMDETQLVIIVCNTELYEVIKDMKSKVDSGQDIDLGFISHAYMQLRSLFVPKTKSEKGATSHG